MLFKKFSKKCFVALALATVLVLSLALGACGDKSYDSTEAYVKHIEGEAIKTGVEKLSAVYDNMVSPSKKGVSGKSEIDIDISENALSMLQLATDMDFSWLSNISIDGTSFQNNDMMAMKLMLGLGESKLLGLDLIFDNASNMAYFTLPGVLSKYLSIDIAELAESAEVDMSSLSSVDLSKLPDGDSIKKLANKYVDIILSGIRVAEESKGKLTANGVEESCSVVKIIITEKNAMDIARSVLETAKNDAELKKVIVDFANCIAELDEYSDSGENVYAEFCEFIDETLEDMSDETADDDVSSAEDNLIITDYVNFDDEIIGRTVAFDNEEMFSYGFASNGKNFGFELKANGVKYVSGSGTVDSKMNGDFSLCEDDVTYFTVSVKDLDMKKLEKGYINGTFDLKLDDIPTDDSNMLLSILSAYSIRLGIQQNSANDANVYIGLFSGDEYFVKLSVASKVEKVSAPSLPSASDTIAITEDMDTAALLSCLSLDELLQNIKNSPIPDEYVAIIEQYAALLPYLG